MHGRYDAVVVGTGFASSFFLARYLQIAPPNARILVLERGRYNSHRWQVENGVNSDVRTAATFRRAGDPEKDWNFTIGFGGGSNCWWANSFRLLPNDFRLRSRYGVGRDWPLDYGDLEPYYQMAEEMMAVSGPGDMALTPRSGPYPQPPHRLSSAERILKQAYPDQFFQVATARPRLATATRPACCANGVCWLCPSDAKFTVLNSLMWPYKDPRVTLLLGAEAMAIETAAGRAEGVIYRRHGIEATAHGDIVVLGANAMFNAFLMLKSGLQDRQLGRRLHEQMAVTAEAYLDGVDHFDGSTSVSGIGFMLYDGAHRSERAAALVETVNTGLLRVEHGRWRQVLPMRIIIEDLPEERNRVAVDPADPARPTMVFEGHGDYAQRRLAGLRADLERVLAPLPVERLEIDPTPLPTEAHIQGTTVMGDDPEDSVVDRNLVHHRLRNLLVLGSGAFPSCAAVHPTLTICALSLRAAERLAAPWVASTGRGAALVLPLQ